MQVQATTERALESWWEEGHPGWMIFSLGTQHFETLDEIIRVRSPGPSSLFLACFSYHLRLLLY